MSLWREALGLPQKKNTVAKRSYHAANTGRLFADFMASSRSPDSELRPDLVLMRNRSRELARNDVYVKRFLNLLKTNVVGDKGMTLQVKARNTNGSLDTIGNQIIEDTFYQFGLRDSRIRLEARVKARGLFILSSLCNIAWLLCWHYDYIGLSVVSLVILVIGVIYTAVAIVQGRGRLAAVKR